MGCGGSSASAGPTKQESGATATSNAAPAAAAAPAVSRDAPVPVGAFNFKPVHSAVRWNKPVAEIAELIKDPQAVNCVDLNNGNTPIHIAAQNGHNDLVKFLIESGANVNSKNLKGNTAIHMAIGYDYYQAAMLLINAGADPLLQNDLNIPANRGLEGDKCMGVAALVSATTADEVTHAFSLCEQDLSVVDKAGFASAGMKAKKLLGQQWTADHQSKFREIAQSLS